MQFYWPYNIIGQIDFLRKSPFRIPQIESQTQIPQSGISRLSPGLRSIIKCVWNDKIAILALIGLFINLFEARQYNKIPILGFERQALQELQDRYNQL